MNNINNEYGYEYHYFRLKTIPHAQAFIGVRVFFGAPVGVYLFSHGVQVCALDLTHSKPILYCTAIADVTKARHINAFTQEFCGGNFYKDCKRAYLTDIDGKTGVEVNADLVESVLWDYFHTQGLKI